MESKGQKESDQCKGAVCKLHHILQRSFHSLEITEMVVRTITKMQEQRVEGWFQIPYSLSVSMTVEKFLFQNKTIIIYSVYEKAITNGR